MSPFDDRGSTARGGPRTGSRARGLGALAQAAGRQRALDRALRLGVRAGFALVGWRVRVEGVELLPRGLDGGVLPCVIAAAPHRGWPDPFLVMLAWPRDAPRLAWFGDEVTMTRSWWRRAFLPRLGMVPIPATPSVAAVAVHLDAARLVLGRGGALVVFAEKGPPSPRGRMRTIAPGAAWLALAGNVPLVPVALGGYLETGLGTRFGVRFLSPVGTGAGAGRASWVAAPDGPESNAERGRHGARAEAPGEQVAVLPERLRLASEGRALTADLAAALAEPVAAVEARSLKENGRRPLPGLRRLFH